MKCAGKAKQESCKAFGSPTIDLMENGFAKDLARFGPGRLARPVPLAQARVYCSRLAQSHYENFSVASLFLPRRLLRPFHTVYAYCRWADDLADESGGGQAA